MYGRGEISAKEKNYIQTFDCKTDWYVSYSKDIKLDKSIDFITHSKYFNLNKFKSRPDLIYKNMKFTKSILNVKRDNKFQPNIDQFCIFIISICNNYFLPQVVLISLWKDKLNFYKKITTTSYSIFQTYSNV